MTDNNVAELWQEMKVLVDTIDVDITKHLKKGSHPAGVRARKGLRLLKTKSHELVLLTISSEKHAVNEDTRENLQADEET